jgi:antagonist of KipI
MLLSNTPFEVQAGTVIEIDRFISGRFMYLCISPAIAVAQVFGSRSTYTPAKIGGFEGRRLRAGDIVPQQQGGAGNPLEPFPSTNYSSSVIRIRPGPQADVLNGRLLAHILNTSFTVSTASDRTGYRLDGPAADVTGLTQILSEPACEGAVQITDGGTPIVLMADGPTIGGYNKVAVAIAADLPILAQKCPGESLRFSLV